MCDYSLAGFRNRLAVEGEELVVHRFPTGSLGLTSPTELEAGRRGVRGWWSRLTVSECATAVCLPPYASLLLLDIPNTLQLQLGIGDIEEVIFIQKDSLPGLHRDGLRFKNNQETLLQHLVEGQRVVVRSLLLEASSDEQAPENVEVAAPLP